jgi:hypothetical protein
MKINIHILSIRFIQNFVKYGLFIHLIGYHKIIEVFLLLFFINMTLNIYNLQILQKSKHFDEKILFYKDL